MSDGNSLISISDEQAKLGQEALKVLRGLEFFLQKSLGSVPEDLVGYLGGDWLRIRRAENIAKMMQLAKERLAARAVAETTPASLTIALPILRGAADESRAEVRDLWARLLAAAMDPSRTKWVRQGFSEAIQKMDPPDAALLASSRLQGPGGAVSQEVRNAVAHELDISRDSLDVSLANLTKLGLLSNSAQAYPTPFGREFLLIVMSD